MFTNNSMEQMDANLKGCLKPTVIAAVSLLSAFLLTLTITQIIGWFDDDSMPFENSITIMGEGEVFATADIATLNFTVEETSETVEGAQEMATKKMNAVLEDLKNRDIEDKDIKTQGYNVYPKYEYRRSCPELSNGEFCSGNSVIVGYTVSQSVTIKIRETAKAGDIVAAIGSHEVTNVGGLSFSVDDEETLKSEARALAIADAKAKAKELSKQLDVDLDDIISYSEGFNDYSPTPYGYGGDVMMTMEAKMNSVPSLPQGENVVTVQVYLTFELED